ncbi:MAG: glycoside hydrolase family 3 C-terminal domain-containing protein [Salinivirgaceae bacterium]|jgi:beta-glucosidase|nr:glycoside hydrolase family 3 C-terminal domain-containing protein [Salinivirgaceae bacterium]
MKKKIKQQLNKWFYLLIVGIAIYSCSPKQTYQYTFQNPELSVDKRVENLVSLMTIDEKIGQMVNNAPAIDRLGIPAYNWWNECLHGVARSPYNVTSFPQAIGMAATWNTESLHQMAAYASDEGRAIFNDSRKKGITGIYLGLTYWSPNINIFRDPRWGRGQETYGEDPFLTGALGKAFVTGLQGDDTKYLKASACAKHFAVHSGPEWNRSTYNAQVSDYDLWDTYLPAFQDLIVDANVSGVMCAYNRFEGQPCCGSDELMMDILRKQWGFTGYVTSDCGGINHFWRTHKTQPTKEAAAADAVLHGTDCECSGSPAYLALGKALAEGLITEQQMDVSLKRLFTIRMQLGMFDPDEMVPFAKIDTSVLECEEHTSHALKMARESMVLLKNENNILPLNKSMKKIAVVGPNADDEAVLLSNYYGYPTHITSALEGIKNKMGDKVIYDKGINLVDNKVFKSDYQHSWFKNDEEEGFKGEYFQNTKFEGEPLFVRNEKMIDYRWGDGEKISDSIIARNMGVRFTSILAPEKSGSVTFEIRGDDRSRLFIDDEKQIEADVKGSYYTLEVQKGKTYKLMIEYWQHNDNAEVKFDMGYFEQASPAIIASRVKDADAIIFVGGISAKLEGEEMPVEIEGFRGGDRTNIALPKIQTELMKALKATGKPVVFVNMSGSAIGFEWEAANIPAIVQAWYGGQAGGDAIADVLFGDYNPAGRLPVTFYKNVSDLPDFEDYSMENRTYRYFKGEPLYSFGHGLSYTTFKYEMVEIPSTISVASELTVQVNVTNTGSVDGDEVVQLYLSHKNENHPTPIRVLKGFQRINLKAGESKKVVFSLCDEALNEIDSNGKAVPMMGDLLVSVGGGQPTESSLKNGSVVQKQIIISE